MADLVRGPAIASIALGPDVVVRLDRGIEIYTPQPMDDWIISPHRPTVVRFHGEDYQLVQQRVPEQGGVCYVLQRGEPDAVLTTVGKTIVYDLAYVRDRERARRDDPLRTSTAYALWCLAPLLGMAPSAIQARLHDRFGLHPQTITWAAVLAECGVLVTAAVVVVLELITGRGLTELGGGWLLPWFGGASLLLAPDVVMRVSRLLTGCLRQYGLYEWLWRRFPATE